MFNLDNPLLDVDSYKPSHWWQVPTGTTAMSSYVESRGGQYDKTVFFGLQYILKTALSVRITHSHVDEAVTFFKAHGVPFPEQMFRRIVDVHGGRWPVKIRAVAEGAVVPTRNVLLTIESTDPQCPTVVGYLETLLLRVWYPITVATQSYYMKRTIAAAMAASCDTLDGLPFKLHDFGCRGVSSTESAAIGGAAHLVNFMGSDTVPGILMANRIYNCEMAAFSIPASEHSTITSWGRDGEADAYRNMITQFGGKGKIFAVVSDSYDLHNAVKNLWGKELRQAVIDSGATVVIRPDSGNPVEIVLETCRNLDEAFGSTVNSKNYKVLNHVRVIQGDGITPTMICDILEALLENGYSAENVAFGMGGMLLQGVNRDTNKFAMKCSAACVNGDWREVYKDPITDKGKVSKKGRLSLFKSRLTGEYATYRIDGPAIDSEWEDQLTTVYIDGEIVVEYNLDQIRARAGWPTTFVS